MDARFEFQDRGVLTDSAEICQVASHIPVDDLQNLVSVVVVFLFFSSS